MKNIIKLISLPLLITPLFLSANELETKFSNALEIEKYSKDKAFKIYNTLAEQGLPSAQMKMLSYHLNPHHYKFDFVEKQPEKGKRWLDKELKANNPEAYYQKAITMLFEDYAWGTPESKARDKRYINTMMKSADLGDSEAQYTVASAYMKGIYGLDKDVKKAALLYEASAKKGNTDANIEMAELHGAFGDDLIEPDYQKTYQNILKAYQNDKPEAFVELAKIHARGYRIERNFSKALDIIEELNKKVSAGLPSRTSSEKYNDRATLVSRWEMVNDCDNKAKTVVFQSSLLCAKRNEVRANLGSMGLKAIQEDDRYWNDVYDSSTILPGSKELRVTYTLDGYFAKAEYIIDKSSYESILASLKAKYSGLKEGNYQHSKEFEDKIYLYFDKPQSYKKFVSLRYINPVFNSDVHYVKTMNERIKKYKESKASQHAI